jgi:hypothetical protein
MVKRARWIIVADAGRARVFELDPNGALVRTRSEKCTRRPHRAATSPAIGRAAHSTVPAKAVTQKSRRRIRIVMRACLQSR